MRSNDSVQLVAPPLTWRIASSTTIAVIGLMSKAFLKLANSTTVYGLDDFVKVLDERRDPAKRERGLITVSNHLSVYV
jgi:monolysocardiolipin acyltransferase